MAVTRREVLTELVTAEDSAIDSGWEALPDDGAAEVGRSTISTIALRSSW